ncbi:hypothetical protein DF186_15415, partial [Enterococcus hirae]
LWIYFGKVICCVGGFRVGGEVEICQTVSVIFVEIVIDIERYVHVIVFFDTIYCRVDFDDLVKVFVIEDFVLFEVGMVFIYVKV